MQVPAAFADLRIEAAAAVSKESKKAFLIPARRGKGGRTLRPGQQTPLWNALRAQLRPHLANYGTQVNLGRLLGLPRQRIHAYITRGDQMPDAERTLQLLTWLMAVEMDRASCLNRNVTY